jgi:hypothetical protein
MRSAARDFPRDDEDAFVSPPLATVSDPNLPLALKVVLLALFLPQELSFFVADLRMTLERLVFLILTPILLVQLGQKMAAGKYRFVASDLLVLLAALWMFVGPSVIYDFGEALKHSGPVALEYLISYMSTRILLTAQKQSLVFANWLCVIISIVAIDALMDTVTGRYITRELFGQISGYSVLRYNSDQYRFGLLRASGPLEHQILLGFTCSIGLLIASAVDIALRLFCIAVCALGVVIALSSAPEQSVILGFGLLAYGRLTAGMRGRWMLIFGLASATIAVVFLTVNSPFGHIIDIVTLDPSTGYYRLYIWNTLGPVILDNPYFGVSQELIEQVYGGSVDSLWLVLALLYGIPCAVLAGLAMIGACSQPTSGPRALLTHSESRLGMVLGIVFFLIIFAAFTVHFWGSIWILIGLLIGVRAHLGELGALSAAERANRTCEGIRTA